MLPLNKSEHCGGHETFSMPTQIGLRNSAVAVQLKLYALKTFAMKFYNY